MSYSHSQHWSLVGIRPRLAQASCTAAVHSRQLMELGEPPTAVRVPAWLPPDADRLPVGSPENDMNVLKEIVDRTLVEKGTVIWEAPFPNLTTKKPSFHKWKFIYRSGKHH